MQGLRPLLGAIGLIGLMGCAGQAPPLSGDPATAGDGGWTPAEQETCGNGLDDDGNGEADEGCSCDKGSTQACYAGPAPKAGVGNCAMGEQSCEGGAEFNTWGSCTGWVAPTAEVPGNDEDEDCDGSTGENPPPTTTSCGELTRISSVDGKPAEQHTWVADISGDGRLVLLATGDSGLAGVAQTNDGQVTLLVHDRQSGKNQKVATDFFYWQEYAGAAALSADGRFVAYHVADPGPEPAPGWRMVLFDRKNANEAVIDQGDYNNWYPLWGPIDISADGGEVAYFRAKPEPQWELLVHDRKANKSKAITSGNDFGDCYWGGGALSGDGRFVAYYQPDSPSSKWKVKIHDRQDGSSKTIAEVAWDASYCGGWGWGLALSEDGRYLAYHTAKGPAENPSWSVVLHDTQDGDEKTAYQATGPYWHWYWGWRMDLSADGRYLLFHDVDDPDRRWPLRIYDRDTDRTKEITGNGPLASDIAWRGPWGGALSADGRCIGFSSVELDPNGEVGRGDVIQAYVTANPLIP